MPIQRCQLSSDLAIRCQIGQTKDRYKEQVAGRHLSLDRCPKAAIDAAPVGTVHTKESVIRHVVTLELAQDHVVTLELHND